MLLVTLLTLEMLYNYVLLASQYWKQRYRMFPSLQKILFDSIVL